MTGSFPLAPWILACTAAETIGMSASAAAARAADAVQSLRDGSPALALLLIIGGGLVEGLALGLLQWLVLQRWLPGLSARRWVVSTVLVAGIGWAAASAPGRLTPADGTEPPLPLVLLMAGALGGVMGVALGAAQAGGLVGLVRHPWRWITVSALAWMPAMVTIFAGATTPEADWAFAPVALLAALAGAAAGAVLGTISGLLAPALGPLAPADAAARSTTAAHEPQKPPHSRGL